jgi:SAM-dependent methyltransferase
MVGFAVPSHAPLVNGLGFSVNRMPGLEDLPSRPVATNLCEMNETLKPTERFSNRADDYRRYRPGYPKGVTDLMLECGLGPGARVADIGAGTGIFTRLLLEAGFEVTAVEPNAAMRAAAVGDLRDFPGFHAVDAPAEATGLPAGSIDAITVAQAFHWFDQQAAGTEFRRLLRQGGWVFIVRNQRLETSSPFARDYEEMLRTLGEQYRAIGHRDRPARDRAMKEFFPPGSLRVAQYDNPHVMDWATLRGRLLSMSYIPTKGEPGHHELLARLEEIFRTHAGDGRVTFEQITEVYYGHLEPVL